jgi:asparagine synthetase B (glutamine-hydrolysing)
VFLNQIGYRSNTCLYYGIESFSMLDGMFAFSIHDKKTNKVLIARDFFEKNLYTTVKTVIVLSGLQN